MPLNVVIQLKIQLKRQAYTNKRAVIFLILLMKRNDSVEYREYHAAKVYDRLQFISEMLFKMFCEREIQEVNS